MKKNAYNYRLQPNLFGGFQLVNLTDESDYRNLSENEIKQIINKETKK